MTPIIFSLNTHFALTGLLANRTVTFNLDCFNPNRQWPSTTIATASSQASS
jgi:hypothetical protein